MFSDYSCAILGLIQGLPLLDMTFLASQYLENIRRSRLEHRMNTLLADIGPCDCQKDAVFRWHTSQLADPISDDLTAITDAWRRYDPANLIAVQIVPPNDGILSNCASKRDVSFTLELDPLKELRQFD